MLRRFQLFQTTGGLALFVTWKLPIESEVSLRYWWWTSYIITLEYLEGNVKLSANTQDISFLKPYSHVAQILRRFRRVCAAVGSTYITSLLQKNLQSLTCVQTDRRIHFISCSATLSNPADYMSKMFGLNSTDVDVVSNDGAPSGSKEYLIWNPPPVDIMDPSLGRRSSLSEASDLMRSLMKEGVRVILFCKVRYHFS